MCVFVCVCVCVRVYDNGSCGRGNLMFCTCVYRRLRVGGGVGSRGGGSFGRCVGAS